MRTAKGEQARTVERFARVGYAGKAVLYVTIGVLAAGAALGAGGKTTDTRGAMGVVVDAPFGRVLLLALALGLLGYAAWRIIAAVADPEQRGHDVKGLALRASYGVRGLVHLGMAYGAIKLAVHRASPNGGGSGQRAKHWTATAFDLPGGEWIVWAVAIGVAGYGAYQVYRAWASKVSEQLDLDAVSRETGRWVLAVARFGIAARGIVFIAIGWLLVSAARQRDPGEAGGIAEALRTIERLGRWPFVLVAVGLVAYGGYQVLNARYRRIKA